MLFPQPRDEQGARGAALRVEAARGARWEVEGRATRHFWASQELPHLPEVEGPELDYPLIRYPSRVLVQVTGYLSSWWRYSWGP